MTDGRVWGLAQSVKSEVRLRLFCLPYAGGGAAIFRGWQARFPATIAVCPLQLPGREGRLGERLYDRSGPLVEALAEVLQPYLDLPYAFFGHSMGGMLSFELTRCLRRAYQSQPQHLFVSAARAPHMPDPDPPIHTLPDPELLVELRKLAGTPEAVLQNAELMQLLLPTLRADFAVCETYRYTPEPPLACPITAFGGLRDVEVSREQIAGWREQTTGAFKMRFFAGDHFFLQPEQATLTQYIARELPISGL